MSHEEISHSQPIGDDKVDTLAFQVTIKAFGRKPGEFFLTNRSKLENFLPNAGQPAEGDFPGHALIPYSQVPLDDRDHLYKPPPVAEEDRAKVMVWYPPLVEAEIKQQEARNRDEIAQRVEGAFDISFAGFEGATTVCSVADYIAKIKTQQLKKLNESS